MSWAEEQPWFGTEDMIEQYKFYDPKKMILRGFWVQNDWEPIALRSMTWNHLKNCIKMIEDGRLKRTYALPYLKKEIERRLEKVNIHKRENDKGLL